MYEFQYKDLQFSRDGLDSQLTYDRYSVSTHNPDDINVDDTVVVLIDKKKDIRRVGEVTHKNDDTDTLTVLTRQGDTYTVDFESVSKPLELEPHQLWTRWAKAAASVEDELKRADIEDKFRQLLDGYGYSPGGRIQLGLGQEYVTGLKAALTLYNCFVIKSPRSAEYAIEQWMKVLDSAHDEMNIQRRGGGVGMSLSDINTVKGAGDVRIALVLPMEHHDSDEYDEKISIGKFDHVDHEEIDGINVENYIVEDSVDGLVKAMRDMVQHAYFAPHKPLVLDFSEVRHRGAYVKGTNGRSSGAVAWMELFDLVASLLQQDEIDAVDFAEVYSGVTNLIEQGGSRRGALMLILEDRRHDILKKFITRKQTVGKLTGANISVAVSDDFMQKRADDSQFENEIWDLICESAWKSAEPGVVFLARCNKESNSWYFRELVATNPCGR